MEEKGRGEKEEERETERGKGEGEERSLGNSHLVQRETGQRELHARRGRKIHLPLWNGGVAGLIS